MSHSKRAFFAAQYGLVLMLCAVGSATRASDVSASSTEEAIDQLKAIEAKIPPLVTMVDQIDFGPFNFSGSCDFDCHWYCFGCCQTENWTYKPDFGAGKAAVEQSYRSIGSTAATFALSFSKTRTWLLSDVPSISAAFATASQAVDGSLAIYTNPSSTAEQKAQAKQDILAAIQTLLEEVESSRTALAPAVADISAFTRSMSSAFSAVSSAEGLVNSMFQAAEGSVQRHPFNCGEQGCMGDLQNAESAMRRQLGAVRLAAEATGVDSDSLDKSTSLLLGSLVDLQQQMNGVLQNLKDAKISPSGAVQTLRLDVAHKTWQRLSDYAQKELAGG